MSDVLDRVQAQMEHFRDTVCPDAQVVVTGNCARLVIATGRARLHLLIVHQDPFFVVTMNAYLLDAITDPTAVARVGGLLIQLSNLMTQIQALAPEVPSVSSEERPAAVV